MTKEQTAKWWKRYLDKIGFPTEGHFLVVPTADPKECMIMHGETGVVFYVPLDGETLDEVADFFRPLFPEGEVAAPRLKGDKP
jgi:hypothetical protein